MCGLEQLNDLARELLEKKWLAGASATEVRPRDSGWQAGTAMVTDCPVLWVLPDLIELVAQSHDQPVVRLEGLIRRRLGEQHFIDDGGDGVLESEQADQFDHLSTLIIDVLEEVRQKGLRLGLWSTMPATPPMFG